MNLTEQLRKKRRSCCVTGVIPGVIQFKTASTNSLQVPHRPWRSWRLGGSMKGTNRQNAKNAKQKQQPYKNFVPFRVVRG